MSFNFDLQQVRIGIMGLGYVGLPLAVAFGERYPTLGFDVDTNRIAELRAGRDSSLEVEPAELRAAKRLTYTDEAGDEADCNLFIVTVPTPIDVYKRPDLSALKSASNTVGVLLKVGDIVIYESTVYPGATEEICIPILERISELEFNWDFFVGYRPERINPGDKEHRLTTIKKVTSGSTPKVADFIDALYRSIIPAGTYKVSSIRVAEAAKVIENTQRDLNIALVNELALIFNRLGIDTQRSAGSGGQQVELSAFLARPGGRTLYRRRSLLSYPQSPGHRLSSGDHPRQPPPQRPHGCPDRRPGRQAHDPAQPGSAGQSGASTRSGVQGKLPGSA